MRQIVEAMLADGDFGASLMALRAVRWAIAPEQALDCLQRYPPPRRAEVERLLTAAFGERDVSFAGVLHSHLRQAVERVRACCARPVLLTYPFADDGVDAVLQRLERELQVERIDLRRRFAAELQRRPRSELFASDGHCNDAGYAIVAEEVAAAIDPHLRR